MLSPVFLVCIRWARTSAVTAAAVVTTALPRWYHTLPVWAVCPSRMKSSTTARPARAEHSLSGHREGPGGVFAQYRFRLGHIHLVQGVGVVRHRLLEFGDHETTVSTILPWMWPCAARVCALPASDSG